MTDLSPWRSIGVLALALTVCACSDLSNCPVGTKEPQLAGHNALRDPKAVTYESAPWGGTLDAFPAKTVLRFRHELGVVPLIVKVYLAFDDKGTNNAGDGSVAESAGNQDLIDCVDAHVIDVKNDTCEKDFYIRVIAAEATPVNPKDPTGHNEDCMTGDTSGAGGASESGASNGGASDGGASNGGASEGGAPSAGAPG